MAVPVRDEEGQIIGEVRYNENLDFWDGRNMTCGGVGLHKGLAQLSNGDYILINGSQWQGSRDFAEIISPEQAVREILHSGNDVLFEEFPELVEVRKKTILMEKE